MALELLTRDFNLTHTPNQVGEGVGGGASGPEGLGRQSSRPDAESAKHNSPQIKLSILENVDIAETRARRENS